VGLVVHIILGCFYSVMFIVGYRSLKAGELDSAAKYGLAGVAGLSIDIALRYLGVGMFS
jgi:hypothetical protein